MRKQYKLAREVPGKYRSRQYHEFFLAACEEAKHPSQWLPTHRSFRSWRWPASPSGAPFLRTGVK
eukprot:1871175-Rhodomonas_salina.5